MPSKKHRKICETVEELLIQQSVTALTEKDAALVREHVQACPDCRLFESQLAEMQQSEKFEKDETLVAHPEIHAALTQRLNELKQQNRESIFSSTWERVRRIFEYRIPVYQGILGAAVIAIIFLFFQNFNVKSISQGNQQIVPPVETNQFTNVQVIHDLKIVDDQKIGTSVSEDTLLTKYVFSVM